MTRFICWSKKFPVESKEHSQIDDTKVLYSKGILSMCRQSRSFEKYAKETQSSIKSEASINKLLKSIPFHHSSNLQSNSSIITEV